MEAKPTTAIAASVLGVNPTYEIGEEQEAKTYLEPTLSIAWNIHQGHFDQFEIITLYRVGDGQFTEAHTEVIELGPDRHITEVTLPEFEVDVTAGRDPFSRDFTPYQKVTVKCLIQAVNPKCAGGSVKTHSRVIMSTSAELTSEL